MAAAAGTRRNAGESRWTDVGGARSLHARVWSGRGVPTVLLHGLLDSADGWNELCRCATRPCVAIDLPGFGGSDLPARPSLRAYAEDVATALSTFVPGEFVLVGHSLGGGVATALAEQLPERTRALVLLAPAGFGRIPLAELVSLPGVRDVTEHVLPFALGNRRAVAAAYRAMIANGLAATPEILDRVIARGGGLVPGAREATKAVVRAGVSSHGFGRRRIEYEGPVHVVWGDRDRLVPIGHMAHVRAAFPHAETAVWRGMGHHPQCERPAQLAELVERACAEAGPAPGPARRAA